MGFRLIEGLAGARGRHRKDMDRFYASNSEKRLPNRIRQPLNFISSTLHTAPILPS
jgi:hypothetical protein